MGNQKSDNPKKPGQDPNMTEEVLRQGGKSEEEVRRTGEMDRADDKVEDMFEDKFKTANSPLHKAVWSGRTPISLFRAHPGQPSEKCVAAMKECLDIVRGHRQAGTLYAISDKAAQASLNKLKGIGDIDAKLVSPTGDLLNLLMLVGTELDTASKKVSEGVIAELAETGYFRMLIEEKYGGLEAPINTFMRFLMEMSATGDPTIAGLASIHQCIGAVDPVQTFGTDEQKARLLPVLGSGESISGFALTEPNAGSDLTALRTKAVLNGDHYEVTGEKLFISNATHGHSIGLVCLIEGKPAVLIARLPEEDNETFQLVNYKLWALTHTFNNGLRFNKFRVPKENLLTSDLGDGLIMAYHGLNRGRVALDRNAGGVMRLILRSITPDSWAAFRKTYGQSIDKRELVQFFGIGRLAALIVGSDAWGELDSSLLDEGYRGEAECIPAKVFGSEAQKEAAIECGMKTHGGRSFLHGNLIGDNIHDYLAPMIYEGEGRMLWMGLFKALSKAHGTRYMLPLGNGLNGMIKGIKKGNLLSAIGNFFKFGFAAARWGIWTAVHTLIFAYTWLVTLITLTILPTIGINLPIMGLPGLDGRLRKHVRYSCLWFRMLPLKMNFAMAYHQLKLADRQVRMVDLSERIQHTATILVTALHAYDMGDEGTIAAADVLCRDLTRKLKSPSPSDADVKASRRLSDLITGTEKNPGCKFRQLDGVPTSAILRKYSEKPESEH